MSHTSHDLKSLFLQLGRPNDDAEIARFIETNSPLAGNVLLHEASFWTRSQADFLREAITDDSEWAEIVDVLNSKLHALH
jgi:Protein of unknown function (DUF2789)